MSAVELSKAKAGDVVHFRCGGSSAIEHVGELNAGRMHAPMLQFVGCFDHTCFRFDGSFSHGEHPFDIVKVERK